MVWRYDNKTERPAVTESEKTNIHKWQNILEKTEEPFFKILHGCSVWYLEIGAGDWGSFPGAESYGAISLEPLKKRPTGPTSILGLCVYVLCCCDISQCYCIFTQFLWALDQNAKQIHKMPRKESGTSPGQLSSFESSVNCIWNAFLDCQYFGRTVTFSKHHIPMRWLSHHCLRIG